MSLWSSFTSAISNKIVKPVTSFGTDLITGNLDPIIDAPKPGTEQELKSKIQSGLRSVNELGIKGAERSTDWLLRGAVALNNRVISPYITRPMSTLALLTDINSPLYKKGQYDEGFQFKDIDTAYKRSAVVSTGQALTKSVFTQPISTVVLAAGKININDVDLWNDESIQKNFSDNMVGKYYTGLTDLFVGNAGITKAFGLAGKGVGKGLNAAGVSTRAKTVEQFSQDIQDGFNYADNLGGRQTVAASHMMQLADSKNLSEIDDLVQLYSNNERLSSVILSTTKKETVRDLILADKGDVNAILRLSETNGDDLVFTQNVVGQIQNKYLQTGQTFIPEGPAVERLKKAWDTAIEKDPRLKEMRNAFFDESDQLKVLGKTDYFPVEPKIPGLNGITESYIKTESALRIGKAVTKFDEFRGLGTGAALAEVLTLRVGSTVGRPTTNLIKFRNAVTGLKPLRFVTLGGMRPFDARVELTSFVDAIPTFKNGNAIVNTDALTQIKVADLRKQWETEFLTAKSPGDQYKVLEKIDEQIGFAVAWNHGYKTEELMKANIKNIRSSVAINKRAHEKTGYSFDADGSMNVTDALSTSQMAQSYLFSPWDSIEREIILRSTESSVKRGFGYTKKYGNEVYQELTKLWTFNALVRPMYAIKQSIAEPMISAALGAGLKTAGKIAWTGLKNSTKNNVMIKPAAAKAKFLNKAEIKAINRQINATTKKHNELLAMKEVQEANIADMLTGKTSPAAKDQNLPKLRKQLESIDKTLDAVELNLVDMYAPLGKKPNFQNISSLERRIAYIEKTAPKTDLVNMQKALDNAKSGIAAYRNLIARMSTNKKIIKEADSNLKKSYAEIDKILEENSLLQAEQANVFSKSAEYKKRYYGSKDNQRMLNGEMVDVTSFFDDITGNNLSKAIRAEVDNTNTLELNFLGELSLGNRQAVLAARTPNVPIDITNPVYFGELEHVSNQLIRNDKLNRIILSDPSTQTLAKWVSSQEGIRYLDEWGVHGPEDGLAYVKTRYATINRTVPSKEARAILAQREITENELRSILAPKIKDNQLFPIAPSDWSYAEGAIFGAELDTALPKLLSNAASSIYKKLNSVENPIRENYFDEIAMTKLTKKVESLTNQGVEVTTAQWNALRQAASREALQETEKVFYTIRRQNSIVYALRAAVAFPAASLNAVYRYGRLAVKNPVRMTGFAYNYGRTFENFGVDKYGNPTDDIDQIAWLAIPFNKEMKTDGNNVFKLNAKSLGFLLNSPSPSFITSIGMAKVFKNWPTAEDYASGKKGPEWIQTLLGAQYNAFFPYGPQTSITKAFTPSWGNAVYNYAVTPMGKTDFLSSVNSIYRYHKILIDMGIETEIITEEQAIKEAKGLWLKKFLVSFANPAGVPSEVNLYPTALIDGLYSKLTDKYQKQGNTREQAKTLAGDELLTIVGPELLLDNVTFKDYNKNIPGVVPTVENYNRIFKDNYSLVQTLAGIKDGDVSLVGLLGADIEYKSEDRNTAISNLLNDPNLRIPGTSKLVNDTKLTPREEDIQRQKNVLWDRYNAVKEALTATITDGKSFRSHQELGNTLQYIASTMFKNESQEWFDDYSAGLRGDNSYNYARAFKVIVNDDNFMKKNGSTDYWQDVKTFMNLRDEVAKIYNSYPDGDSRKSKFKTAYLDYLDNSMSAFHPKLQTLLKIYFDNDTLKVVE